MKKITKIKRFLSKLIAKIKKALDKEMGRTKR